MTSTAFEVRNNTLYVTMPRVIDNNNVNTIREAIDKEILHQSPCKPVLCLSEVSVMGPEGLGLVLGIYTRMLARDCAMVLKNLGESVREMFRLAGLDGRIPMITD